jgi:hypothetical protein
MKNMSIKTLTVLCILGLFAGAGIALAVTSIWSPASGPTTSTTPLTLSSSLSAVTWIDETQPTLAHNPIAIHTGDTLELSTVITPTTTNPQTVTFYFTKVVNPTLSTPIGTNPLTQLVIAGTGSGTSTATYDWIVPSDGTYYFIAEIANPV